MEYLSDFSSTVEQHPIAEDNNFVPNFELFHAHCATLPDMATYIQPQTISDGGVVLHYHDYHLRRKARVPMCRVKGWNAEGKWWREDDGLGTTSVCGMCRKIYNNRYERRRKQQMLNNRKMYRKHYEKRLEANRKYREECHEALIKAQRARYERDREIIRERAKKYRAKRREKTKVYKKEYYQANKEHMKEAASKRYYANREEVLRKRREYYNANRDAILERRRAYDKKRRAMGLGG